jgi:HEAT repeat protein
MRISLALVSLFLVPAMPGQEPSSGNPSPKDTCNQILDAALHDKNPDTRKQAVIALSLANTSDHWIGVLDGMLSDKDVPVRIAVVSSLADLKSKKTNEALHKALNDDVPEVSFAAAKVLFGLGDPAGKDALLAVLEKETKTSSGFFTTQKRDALRLLHTPGPLFYMAVKQGVGFVPVPGLGEGVSSMHALLVDPGTSGRAGAALLLGREKDKETLDALKDALGDKNWSVRAAAVHAIALRNDPAQKDVIYPLCLDKAEGVRLRAAVGWLRLDSIAKGSGTPRSRAQKSGSGTK